MVLPRPEGAGRPVASLGAKGRTMFGRTFKREIFTKFLRDRGCLGLFLPGVSAMAGDEQSWRQIIAIRSYAIVYGITCSNCRVCNG